MPSTGKSHPLTELKLFVIFLSVKLYQFLEEIHVRREYYGDKHFKACDRAFAKAYRGINRYRLCKDFLFKRGEKDLYQYGETPLSSLAKIAKECGITQQDRVIDLGCGSGRPLFFLSQYLGCQAWGIDWVPQFISIGQCLVDQLGLKNLRFTREEIFQADLRWGTVIYLYGTCLEEKQIHKIIQLLDGVAPGTKIITVSYSLIRYAPAATFTFCKRFSASYPWGKAELFLQIKR